MPVYLQTRVPVSRPGDASEMDADRAAERVMRLPEPGTASAMPGSEAQAAAPHAPVATGSAMIQRTSDAGAKAAPAVTHTVAPASGGGSALSPSVRSFMEPRFGADFSGVRVHSGPEAARMNRLLGARAFTLGQDIYYGEGMSTANLELTAHELAHVTQQTSGVEKLSIQRDIPETSDLPQGVFKVKAEKKNAPAGSKSGSLSITIDFTPKTDAPYSNQIGLIQIVRLVDADTGENFEPGSLPATRADDLRTQESDGDDVEEGFFVDALHNDAPAHGGTGTDAPEKQPLPPQYPFGKDAPQPNPATPGLSRPFSSGARGATIGYKRSDDPADIKAAQMTDRPGGNANFDFQFETVAKGEDTMNVYGALTWGFELRNGQIQNDTGSALGTQSPTFDAALERHRDFYVHEPVIFYFEFDSDKLSTAEQAKIDEFIAYLGRFPKVRVGLTGFADRRGGRDYNLDLSLRRAQAVDAALRAKGVPDSQISGILVGSGRTEAFTPDATTDQDRDPNRRGNRRVVATFTHTDTTP